MKRQPNLNLPFFAYGLFKPGQLAFFQIRKFVSEPPEQMEINGDLLLRDGLPMFDPLGQGHIIGALLKFHPDGVTDAYDRITAMEPDEYYRWEVIKAQQITANVLVGRHLGKGNVEHEDADWNGWRDPLFTAALDVVEEVVNKPPAFDWNDLKPLFRLQMAYLLLWSSIERYVSLRYYLGSKVTDKVSNLANESAFAESLKQHVQNTRIIYRTDKPEVALVLDRQLPKKAVDYYYQVRSNIVHRGKAVARDYDVLNDSLSELLPIFRSVLKAAEQDADRWPE